MSKYRVACKILGNRTFIRFETSNFLAPQHTEDENINLLVGHFFFFRIRCEAKNRLENGFWGKPPTYDVCTTEKK